MKYFIFILLLSGTRLFSQSGISLSYTYDNLERLTNVISTEGDSIFYNYDEVGNILSIKSVLGGVVIHAKALLQGPYNSSISLMNENLRMEGLIPTQEPYTSLGYTHVMGGGETIGTSLVPVTGSDASIDWVVIELRSQSNPATIVATQSVLLQRDGDIVSADGISPINIRGIVPGNYYVAIRHRNHLGVMTASPIFLTGDVNSPSIDFTLASTAIWGTNAQATIGNVRAMWAGDINWDGVVKYTGSDNDRAFILSKIGGSDVTNVINGYNQEDLNMDGQIKYTGSNNDRALILSNIGGADVTQTINQQIPN